MVTTPTTLRTMSGYAVLWHQYMAAGVYAEQHDRQFCFLPGAFDAHLATNPTISLTQDLAGAPVFASTDDATLRISSDDVGLFVEAALLDTPENQRLCELIDAGRIIRGWSHRWQPPGFPGWRFRSENGVKFYDHFRAELLEVSLVIRKVPRLKNRTAPIFTTGGPSGGKF